MSDSTGPVPLNNTQFQMLVPEFDRTFFASLHAVVPDDIQLVRVEFRVDLDILEVEVRLDNEDTGSPCQVDWSHQSFLSVLANPALSTAEVTTMLPLNDQVILPPGDGVPPPPYQYSYLHSANGGPTLFAECQVFEGPTLDAGWLGNGSAAFDLIVQSIFNASGCPNFSSLFQATGEGAVTVNYFYCVASPGSFVSPYCFGDGTGISCPCANGALGHGCPSSVTSGGRLASTGSPNFGADTFALAGTNLPPNRIGLAIKGSSTLGGGLGSPVGDGLLCLSPQLRSQPLSSNGAGEISMTNWRGQLFGTYPGAANIGTTTYYQWWYRDPNNTCSGQGFNFTNGLSVLWQ